MTASRISPSGSSRLEARSRYKRSKSAIISKLEGGFLQLRSVLFDLFNIDNHRQ